MLLPGWPLTTSDLPDDPMRWLRSLATAAALSVSLVACDEDSDLPTLGGPRIVTGTFDLVTIDGEPLPVTISNDGTTIVEVLSGSVTLNPDRSCVIQESYRETENGVVSNTSVTLACEYTASGSSVTITDENGERLDATLTDGVLSYTFGELEYVYER